MWMFYNSNTTRNWFLMTVPQMLHLFDGSVRCKWDHAVTPSSDANTFICSRAGDFHFNALLLHYYVWYFFFLFFWGFSAGFDVRNSNKSAPQLLCQQFCGYGMSLGLFFLRSSLLKVKNPYYCNLIFYLNICFCHLNYNQNGFMVNLYHHLKCLK